MYLGIIIRNNKRFCEIKNKDLDYISDSDSDETFNY